MPSHSRGTTGDSSSAASALKPSRSYLTLADLEHRDAADDAASGADLDMQSNGQQVTLVQGNQTVHQGGTDLPNPFLDVLPSNVKEKVVSLTPVAPLVYNNNSNSNNGSQSLGGASLGEGPQQQQQQLQHQRQEQVEAGAKRKGRKRQVAYLSIVILVIAIFLRQDAVVDDSGLARNVAESLSSYRPRRETWSYGGVVDSLLGPLAAPRSRSAKVEVEDDAALFARLFDGWNATRAQAPMLTEWGESLRPEDVASTKHHPRPQLQRPGKWVNLNGFWDYRIEDYFASASGSNNNAAAPAPPTAGDSGYEGKILVPFAIESALSGVGKAVGVDKQLVYRRFVDIPASEGKEGERYLLHFGAVDWKTWVYVNGRLAGSHEGGYDAFDLDITDHLRLRSGGSSLQELCVVVWDPTEDGQQPHGKQWQDKASDRLIAPAGMWYTSVTGIWQTVWLETVPASVHIEALELRPDLASETLVANVRTRVSRAGVAPFVRLTALDEDGAVVGSGSGWSSPEGDAIVLRFAEAHGAPKRWSPDSPFLYDLKVSVHLSGTGEAIDEVESYFAMREVGLGRSAPNSAAMAEEAEVGPRFLLNGEEVFQYGVLDQGWWPDGLYTPPSEEALASDILKAKDFGFNLIRKHAKVEPDRFYHLCDKLGMLVWQDMPSASGMKYMWSPDGAHDYMEGEKAPPLASSFVRELQGVVRGLRNHPSIVAWIPFNEGWGQFDSAAIFEWLARADPDRMHWVSGGNDFGLGHALDRHVYPGPASVRPESGRASVLGEFGGNGFAISGHTWQGGNYESFTQWGYPQVESLVALEDLYASQVRDLRALASQEGLAAAIFTQLTDVECEVNGLVTYDRKHTKIENLSAMNAVLYT